MKVNGKEYFVMLNYRTKERYLCSWFENEPDIYGQKVCYIGVTNGLGGYRHMLAKGFVDRRCEGPLPKLHNLGPSRTKERYLITKQYR